MLINTVFRISEILNLYQKNLLTEIHSNDTLKNVLFMIKSSTKISPLLFHSCFQGPSHSYPTNFRLLTTCELLKKL